MTRIFPSVRARIPDTTVQLVGRKASESLRHLTGPSIHIASDVEDVVSFLHKGDVFVVPLRSGGGTRLKVLEAMAAGIPVVSTRFGVAGLAVRDGEHALLADTPAELAAAASRLIEDTRWPRAFHGQPASSSSSATTGAKSHAHSWISTRVWRSISERCHCRDPHTRRGELGAPPSRCSSRAGRDAPLRVVVADDSSEPPLELDVGRVDGLELRVVRANTNRGPGATRNLGLAQVDTSWVAFLDADMLPGPAWVERLRAIARDDNFDGVEGRVDLPPKTKPTPFTHTTEFRLAGTHHGAGNVAFRTEVLRDAGGFDERFFDARRKLHFREDTGAPLSPCGNGANRGLRPRFGGAARGSRGVVSHANSASTALLLRCAPRTRASKRYRALVRSRALDRSRSDSCATSLRWASSSVSVLPRPASQSRRRRWSLLEYWFPAWDGRRQPWLWLGNGR